MRFCLLVALLLGWWANVSAQSPAPPHRLRDTLLLKDPKGAHISEAYRYYTEPFGLAPDPARAEAAWQAGKFRPGPWHETLNLGLLHERVWIRLPARNTEPQRLRFLWNIFNFTDSAALYCRRTGQATFTPCCRPSRAWATSATPSKPWASSSTPTAARR